MTHVELFQPTHLPQVQALVNAHLSTLVPGWGLPEAFIASRLQRNPGEYIVDPWITARVTLCALDREQVVAIGHLLRYGSGIEVDTSYHNVGEIAWFLARPDESIAAAALLAAIHDQFSAWGVPTATAWQGGLPASPFAGLPDVWPHIAVALMAAGYHPDPNIASQEAAYAGRLDLIAAPTSPPLADLRLQRTTGRFGTRFTALIDELKIGYCECISDLSEAGALPALRGWGELAELEVGEPWRSRGIGAWLVQHAAAWLQLGGCDRIVLTVAAENEAAGAGRFYQRCGWRPLARLQRGWVLHTTKGLHNA
jgi:GNAT superfamily N-acetyltransferase